MAEIVYCLIGSVIEVGKCIGAPIKRRFIYLCCFGTNVQILNKEAKKLEDKRDEVQAEVNTAERDGQVIYPQVMALLEEVEEILEVKSQLDTQINKIRQGGCLCWKSRYTTSKRSAKIATIMKDMSEGLRSLTVISHPPRPVSMDIQEVPTVELESRKKIEEDLMAKLKDGKVGLVGICGMGGVGKTTLAVKIKNRVMKEHVYYESVMVVVSQYADKQRIQGEIAEQLGMELVDLTFLLRAHKLHARLTSESRILIILDDIWGSLDLEELGIPCKTGHEGCTVLLTSRDRDVLKRMGAETTCVIEPLTEEEAWSFFKIKLGTSVDDQNNFSSLAREITKECKGLPLVLGSVATTLKDEKNISAWKEALQQLRSSNPEDMSDVLNEVYAPLKLSYDYLRSQEAKSIFLLCSLFPQDFDITLEDLTAYAMGLGMFEGNGHLEQVRNRTEALVAKLKSCFLLFEGCDGRHVRMNGFVRDVAIFIASYDKRLIKCGDNSTWISPFLGERVELSKGSIFPNLHLLLIDNSDEGELQINDIPFEGMKELKVLSVISDCSLTSLPHTTKSLTYLKTLILKKCRSLKNLCAVEGLVNLEVLYCRDCGSIEELPMEIGGLNQLKLLHISDCERLKTIAAGVISRLLRLEELTLLLEGSECPQMKRFTSGSFTSTFSFENLESIEITSWQMLELVLWNEEENGSDTKCRITFPKLEKLQLHDLPRLTPLCKGIEFPLLTRMEIAECPSLMTVFSSMRINDKKCSGAISNDADNSLHLFCKVEDVVHDVAISVAGTKALSKSFPREQTNDSIDELAADNITKFDVLYVGHHTFISQLPPKICLLVHVRKLILESCASLEDISVVRELVSLEILFCHDCGLIEELPVKIGTLNQLKLLHFSDCKSLERIAAGVISRLIQLEELTLIRSFKKWDVDNNAALDELGSLCSLTTLRIEVEDASLAAKQIGISSRILEFDVTIGNPTTSFHTSSSFGREMQLVVKRGVIPGYWVHELVMKTESLVLQGEGSSELIPIVPEFKSLKRLIFQNAKRTRLSEGTTAVFPVLESLYLEDIEDLEEIHSGLISPDSFKNLQEIILVRLPKLQRLWNITPRFCNLSSIYIAKCDSLCSLFPLAMASKYLFRLKRMIIRSNSMLEQVAFQDEEGNGQSSRMGKLQYLDLCDLQRFTSLFKGIDSIEFKFNCQKSRQPLVQLPN